VVHLSKQKKKLSEVKLFTDNKLTNVWGHATHLSKLSYELSQELIGNVWYTSTLAWFPMKILLLLACTLWYSLKLSLSSLC